MRLLVVYCSNSVYSNVLAPKILINFATMFKSLTFLVAKLSYASLRQCSPIKKANISECNNKCYL